MLIWAREWVKCSINGCIIVFLYHVLVSPPFIFCLFGTARELPFLHHSLSHSLCQSQSTHTWAESLVNWPFIHQCLLKYWCLSINTYEFVDFILKLFYLRKFVQLPVNMKEPYRHLRITLKAILDKTLKVKYFMAFPGCFIAIVTLGWNQSMTTGLYTRPQRDMKCVHSPGQTVMPWA